MEELNPHLPLSNSKFTWLSNVEFIKFDQLGKLLWVKAS